MTKTRGIVYGVVIVVAAVLLWRARHAYDTAVDKQVGSVALKADETDKIIVSPRSHTIEIVTRKGVERRFLPSGGASIVRRVDGSIQVGSRSWGTETSPFLGAALGSDIVGRAAVGLNVFYVQRWEFGGGLLLDSRVRDARTFVHVSYNAYGNIFVSGAIDNRKTAHLIVGLKF